MFEGYKVKAKIFRARSYVVAFRLFLWVLGAIAGGSGMYVYFEGSRVLDEYTSEYGHIVIENPAPVFVETVHAEEVEPEEWEMGEFSAYTASENETDADPWTMASGRRVYVGAVACPSFLRFGERIEVRGVGVLTCEDRMNSRYRDTAHFDIFHNTKGEAFAFGRKTLEWRRVQ